MSLYLHSNLTARALDVWRRSHLARHLVEMYLAMQIGMALGTHVLAIALGAGVGETRTQHPVAFLLVMAFAMTVPMIAWMLHRGHSARSTGEMAVVMLAPALALVGLQMSHLVSTSACGGYMAASTLGMIVLAVYRRSEYRTSPHVD